MSFAKNETLQGKVEEQEKQIEALKRMVMDMEARTHGTGHSLPRESQSLREDFDKRTKALATENQTLEWKLDEVARQMVKKQEQQHALEEEIAGIKKQQDLVGE